MPNTIDQGETFPIAAAFAATPEEPVLVSIKKPDGEVVGPYVMTKELDNSLGLDGVVYRYDYTADEHGLYHYRIETSDGVVEATHFFAKKNQVVKDDA